MDGWVEERMGFERSIALIPKKRWAQSMAVGVHLARTRNKSQQQRRLPVVAAAAPEPEARLDEQEETGIRVCNASGEPLQAGLRILPCMHGERIPVSFVRHSRHSMRTA